MFWDAHVYEEKIVNGLTNQIVSDVILVQGNCPKLIVGKLPKNYILTKLEKSKITKIIQ